MDISEIKDVLLLAREKIKSHLNEIYDAGGVEYIGLGSTLDKIDSVVKRIDSENTESLDIQECKEFLYIKLSNKNEGLDLSIKSKGSPYITLGMILRSRHELEELEEKIYENIKKDTMSKKDYEDKGK